MYVGYTFSCETLLINFSVTLTVFYNSKICLGNISRIKQIQWNLPLEKSCRTYSGMV